MTPSRTLSSFAAIVCLSLGAIDAGGQTPAGDAHRLFVTRVKPLLVQKCGACHGETAEEMKGGFDLRSRETLIAGGDSGEPAINLQRPEESTLLLAISWQGGWEMPPKENDRLSSEQIGWIRQWILAGAPWPSIAEIGSSEEDWQSAGGEGGVRVTTSGGTTAEWTQRLYDPKDLWAYRPVKPRAVPWSALPPGTPTHAVEAFVQQRLAQRTLAAAPRADRRALLRRATYDLTGLPPSAAQLEAFLRDDSPDAYVKLVDRLLASPHYGERMAQHWLDVVRYADSNGFSRDELRDDAHRYRSYVIRSFNEDKPFDVFIREQIAGDQLGLAGQEALAMLWMGPWEHTNMSVAAVTRQLWLDDVTNSIGVSFLGQQLRCAKCHDHKFDPIPTRDYYRFQAIFASTRHHIKAGQFKIQPQQQQQVSILAGGALESPGDPVSPGALSLLAATANHTFELASPDQARAAIALWISDARNPLTARVIVNRVWQMHFGQGLVATPNDLGKMGADPTHPELLDWLAQWLVDHQWSLKKLHRLLMTTPTYCRSSTASSAAEIDQLDPKNTLLSYFPPRRLTAEEIRDSMLAISGEWNRQIGGPSVYPKIHWEVAFQPRLAMGKLVPPYQPDPTPRQRNRRSLYAVRIRNLGHPMMEVFNRPGSDLSCERRDETTVTPQVFTLLHGEFVHDRAVALADRVARKRKDVQRQVEAVYRAVYGRPPTSRERSLAAGHVLQMTALHQQLTLKPEVLPTVVKMENIKEKTGEAEQITFQLEKLAQYQEDLKPWEVDARTRALADLCLVLFNSSEFLYVY